MKITKISLINLGPYVGENNFDFSVDNPEKKVVLIGGKNGAGKTTLFNSLKTGLYGCLAYGYESNNSKYYEHISDLINSNVKIEKKGVAGVTISILMEDGKNDYTYSFKRSWIINAKSLREEVEVLRNGKALNDTEKSDFQSYLLQLIPPDMFKFYFFDGESIGNFVFSGVKNTDFKNAFLKLCGLDTMEIIYDNFQKLANSKRQGASDAYDQYKLASEELKVCDENLNSALEKKAQLESDIIGAEEDLAKLESDFVQRGGITKAEYQAMLSELNKEEAKRDISRKWLKETANEILPFIILKKELVNLKKQIAQEEKATAAEALYDCLNNAEVRLRLCNIFEDEEIEAPFFLADKVINSLASTMQTPSVNQILNFSKYEQLDVLAKINSVMNFNVASVHGEAAKIDESLARVKQIRNRLDKSDSSESESYFEKKERLLTIKSTALQSQLGTERTIEALRIEKAEAESKYKKAQQKYEEYLKSKSVNDVTAKALLAFGDLQKRLYKKYISDVEASFKECFSKLINKSDLIDGIVIDDQLQVIPYRMQTFSRKSIVSILTDNGPNYLISQLGSAAYEAFIADTEYNETIELPVEVRQKLSAGEKQIFIMALYQALSSLNKVSVPYIIDTPFARIDTEHRQNILNNFFMNLKGQMLILSTDEEIVGPYKASISDCISDEFLLKHEDNNGTKVCSNTYFSEAQHGL